MNINRLKTLTRRDLNFISESKLQELRNKGYILEEECGSCNQRNLGMDGRNGIINGIQSLTPTCPTTAPYYNKKYYGLQITPNTVGPGVIKLGSMPSGGTSPYAVKFYKDGSATELAGTTQPVVGTFENWYVPALADVTTGSPVGSHTFNSTVLDSCVGSQLVTETPCTMIIVDLATVNASPTSVTLGAGQGASVNLSYLDTVGAAYPTGFTGSSTQLLAQTATMSGTLASYISLGTTWPVNSVAPVGITVSLLAGAPAGATGSVRLPVKVSTSTTTKYVDVNVASCSTPVCNFSVS